MCEEIIIRGKFTIEGSSKFNNVRQPLRYLNFIISPPGFIQVHNLSAFREKQEVKKMDTTEALHELMKEENWKEFTKWQEEYRKEFPEPPQFMDWLMEKFKEEK